MKDGLAALETEGAANPLLHPLAGGQFKKIGLPSDKHHEAH